MYDHDENAEHQAVTRLFELARSGDIDNCEYSQLDSMVYGRLEQAYAGGEPATPASAIRVQAAAP